MREKEKMNISMERKWRKTECQVEGNNHSRMEEGVGGDAPTAGDGLAAFTGVVIVQPDPVRRGHPS